MKRNHLYLALALTGLFVAPALADTYAITGGTVYTLGAAGKIEHGTVVIKDGKITAVGAGVAIPADAKRIDATGKMVTPGIIDPESVFGLDEVDAVNQTQDSAITSTHFTASFDPTAGINPRSMVIPVNRVEGVTRAVIAPGNNSSVLQGRGSVISLDGLTGYVLKDPVAMFVTLGEAGQKTAGGARAGALMALREAFQDAKDYAANRVAYDKAARRGYSLSREDLEALQPVLKGKMPLVVQVDRASDIEAALALASEFRLKLVVSGGAEAWMVADELAKAKVPVILNPTRDLPEAFESLGADFQDAVRLQKAGVLIAFEVGDTHKSWNVRQYGGIAVSNGLPWLEAVKAMTLNPARIYGLDKGVGTLEVGKDADLVVWSGDPLEVTSFADQVFIRGKAIPMTDRQRELRDRYLPYVKPDAPVLPPAYSSP
ncbi:MAG TPA: amidohydrolase family protein [Gammaproteobacteria bacterium]|nr:amidohydrolase family protein [Gammaproteobacteria bacterium]